MHAFDTHKYIKELQECGVAETQAEVMVKQLLESRAIDCSSLVSRDQLAAVEERLTGKINVIEKELSNVEKRLEQCATKEELKAEIANLQSTLLRWIIPLVVSALGMMAGMLSKLILNTLQI